MHRGFFAILAISTLVFVSQVFASEDTIRKGVRWAGIPIANYTTDKGLTLGAAAERFNYGDPTHLPFQNLLIIQGRSSSRAQSDALLEYETTDLDGSGDYRLDLLLYGLQNSYSRYYGLGEASPFDLALDNAGYYFHQQKAFIATSTLRTKTRWNFEFQTALSLNSYSDQPNQANSKYAEDFGNNSHESIYPTVKLGTIWERRNFEFIPDEGYYLESSGTLSTNWLRADLDYRRYDSLIEHRWLWFASQAKLSATTPDAPLQEKARLGGMSTLRGLPLNRFVASYSASVRGELRSILIRKTLFSLPLKGGLGVFADTGKVFDQLDRITAAPLQWAVGMSFFASYFTDDFLGIADIGFSKEGSALYLKIGHAF